MITTLHIKNIGIIDDLTIDLNEGLNILTGETGAGKTLIIDAIGIASGERFSKEMIRHGEDHSFVELNIYCPESPLAIDGNIIITREVYANGRNSCKINGRLVTVNELKETMNKIIDIHGQHDNQLLLEPKYNIKYLDGYIGKEIVNLKEQYSSMHSKRKEIKEALLVNYGDDKEKERKLDLLNYQLKEINAANLKKNEDIELEERYKVISNFEKIQTCLSQISENLNNGVIEGLSNSIKALEKIEVFGNDYGEKLNNMKSIYYEIQELSRDFDDISNDTEFNEYDKKEIEDRLDLIYSLKRKYGNSIDEILEYKESIKKEINDIENKDEINKKLKYELESIEEKMKECSDALHEIRLMESIILSEKINQELKDLEMFSSVFSVKIEKQQEFLPDGMDKVEFYISTNTGEEAKPLAKIASGGEMSRIMLAIKTVLASIDEVPVLVFDEIDTGISGKAAKAVGNKLKAISKYHQVMCITHLAPIAAKGDYNYYISKKVEKNKTLTNVKLLDEEEVILEIARISSGEVTDISKKHAEELRKAS